MRKKKPAVKDRVVWWGCSEFARDKGLVDAGCECVSLLMARALGVAQGGSVPPDAAFDTRLILGEALSNAVRYGRGHRIELHRSVIVSGAVKAARKGPQHLKLCRAVFCLTYQTTHFIPRPVLPELLAGGGYGLWVIRHICQDGGGRAEWRFSGHPLDGGVQVVLVKRWDGG